MQRGLLISRPAAAELAALLAAVALSAALGTHALGPALAEPEAWLVGSWIHPDCLSNHWLLAWVADRLAQGQGVLHNPDYYWPVGDAPVLAGNGAEGFLYLPLHLALGWPRAVPPFVLLVLTLNGVGGWALARAAGAGRWASLVGAGLTAASPYVVQELGAGRFTQADTGFLLLFLASWLALLDRPGWGRALASAALLAASSLLYWYHGLFGVLAGGVLLLARLRRPPPWRVLALFAGAFLALIGPWLAVFVGHWADIPGTDEVTAFPHPEARLDAARLVAPWTVGPGRHAGMAMALPPFLLGLAGAGVAARGRRWGLLAVTALFALLALGPAFPGAPYSLLYGLAAPLRRFWWPIRHVVLVDALWGVLGALALTALAARLPRLPAAARAAAIALVAVAVVGTAPGLLAARGAPVQIPLTPMDLPPPMAPDLAALPEGVLVEPPLSPQAAGTQQHLVLQRWHHKPLLSGHALWVDRVRPPAWDAFVAANSFLARMQALERGEVEGAFTFDPADLAALREQGVRWFAVDRAAFPLQARGLVEAYRALFDALFGPPVARGPGMATWDAAAWDGHTARVALPAWRWPPDLQRGGPTLPLVGKRPRNRVFEPKDR